MNETKITNTQNCNRQIFMAIAQNGKKIPDPEEHYK
jgi:hypothetical protein